MAELACVAVHPDYQGKGFGDTLLQRVEEMAGKQQIAELFVLTTQSSHWFQERGFRKGDVQSLPMAKRGLYNYRRNSRVLIKQIS
jgi:amino-acid N-acetyltransferase